MSLKAFL